MALVVGNELARERRFRIVQRYLRVGVVPYSKILSEPNLKNPLKMKDLKIYKKNVHQIKFITEAITEELEEGHGHYIRQMGLRNRLYFYRL